ncbi:MAG: flavodoxin family protein [Clostridia bacterium]|nr:flavodoxin family protein [Clostridia bacterium]
MRKLGAFYFSGTGNTRYVTEKLCGLLKNNFEVKRYMRSRRCGRTEKF